MPTLTAPLPPVRVTGDTPPGGVAGDVNLLTDAIRELVEALTAEVAPATVLLGTGIYPTGSADSTTAFAAKIAQGGTFSAPAGSTYVLDSVPITQDTTIICGTGVRFVRKAGADAASGSYWVAGAAMFEQAAPGVTIRIVGATYDGNADEQTATEPTGFFLRTMPGDTVTADPVTVILERCRFENGTSGYLALRGDNAQRRYETRVTLRDCVFTDTVYGVGKGDPSTPNALGYLPNYVLTLDYVRLTAYNFTATWDKPLALGQYAACAINASFYGTNYAESGEPSIHMYGLTYLRGLGRSGKKWDNAADYATNNGIGAIDMYGNADTLFVENAVAENCQNVPIRAKGSLKNYTVLAASLKDCHRGLQVSPSTTGACETVVTVGTVHTVGGTIPQVEFTGTSTGDRIPSVTIGGVNVTGTLTNPEALSLEGAVHLRNIQWLDAKGVQVQYSPARGVSMIDVENGRMSGFRINGTTLQGLYGSGSGTFDLSNFDVTNTGGDGISLAGVPRKITVRDGRVSGATLNGVFLNNTSPDALVENVTVDNVSGAGGAGTGRAFYAGAGNMNFVSNRTGTGVATPFGKHASAVVRELINTWNP